MGNVCRVCTHPNKMDIERAFLNGTPVTQLSQQYGIGQSSIAGHCKDHMPARMVEAFRRKEVVRSMDIFKEIESLVSRVNRLTEIDEKAGKHALVYKGIAEIRQCWELLTRCLQLVQEDNRYKQEQELQLDNRKLQLDYQRKLSVLTFAELQMLEALQMKMQTLDKDHIIIPDTEDTFARVIKSSDRVFRRLNGRIKQ